MNRLLDHCANGAKLDEEDKKLMHRVKVAYAQLVEHLSERVTLQHLKAFWGDQYSESTCRGDIGAAKALFGSPQNQGDREFLRGMLIDVNLESLLKAKNDRDARGVAAISTFLMKVSGMDKDNERPFDPATLRDPIPRVQVFDPTLAGAKFDPDLARKVNLLLEERRAAGQNVPVWEDVPYTPIERESSEG
jgi:hypothetical protein